MIEFPKELQNKIVEVMFEALAHGTEKNDVPSEVIAQFVATAFAGIDLIARTQSPRTRIGALDHTIRGVEQALRVHKRLVAKGLANGQ